MDLAALRRWWPLAAVVGLLCAAAVAATRSTPQLERIPPRVDVIPTFEPQVPTEVPPSTAGGAPPQVSGGLPEEVGAVALAVLGVLGTVLLLVVCWSVTRDLLRRRGARTGRRRTPAPAVRTTEELVAALDAGLLELDDADLDPRRAVIACWVRLEHSAADAGTARHPGDTPTDLVARLLAEQHVDASVLAAFAEVYREARYATHTVDDRMRTAARSALQRLRADLAGGADAAVHTGPVHTGPVDVGPTR